MKKLKLSSVFRDKVNIFYLLAFLPLLPIGYYRYAFFANPLGVFIPLYCFLILLIKKDKLWEYVLRTNSFQRLFGIVIVSGSFFIYYLIVPFVSSVGFYGVANYTVYLFGLFLIFFKISALKQSFTAFFLIIASSLTGIAFRWIELQISPTVPYYVYLFSSLLDLLGVKHTMPNPTTIYLFTSQGLLRVSFVAGCIGVYSLIIFSIVIVVTMVETSTTRRTKLFWSLIGLVGVFVLNIIRLLIVITFMYLYGWDFGQRVHEVIGYVLFLSWLGIFLFIFSKRQTILFKMRSIKKANNKLALSSWHFLELTPQQVCEVTYLDQLDMFGCEHISRIDLSNIVKATLITTFVSCYYG